MSMTVTELIDLAKRRQDVSFLEKAWDIIARQERLGGERSKKLERLFEERRREIISVYLTSREVFGKSNLEAFVTHYGIKEEKKK